MIETQKGTHYLKKNLIFFLNLRKFESIKYIWLSGHKIISIFSSNLTLVFESPCVPLVPLIQMWLRVKSYSTASRKMEDLPYYLVLYYDDYSKFHLLFTETLSSIWTTFLEVCEWNWNLGEKYFGDYGECAMHFTVLYVLPTFRHICMSFARFIHKIRILHRSSSRLLLNPLELSLVVKCQFIGFRLFLPIRR